MLGKPKYTYGDKVKFKIKRDNKEYELIGKVEIIDKYGTFGDNSDVSYDIMVDKCPWNNEPCLFKHFREDLVEKVK